MDQPTSNTEELILGKPVNVGEGNGEDRHVPNEVDRDRVIRQMVQELINEEFGKVLSLLKTKAQEVVNAVDTSLAKINDTIRNGELEQIRADMVSTRESLKELLRAAWIVREAVSSGTSTFDSVIVNNGMMKTEELDKIKFRIIADSISKELISYDLTNKLTGACNLMFINSRW